MSRYEDGPLGLGGLRLSHGGAILLWKPAVKKGRRQVNGREGLYFKVILCQLDRQNESATFQKQK